MSRGGSGAWPTVTRFAPSPTGDLHIGHAYSALFAEAQAQTAGGRFLVRIEDIAAEIAAAAQAPHGPDGPHYPGTCRRLSPAEKQDRMGSGEAYARRLDMAKAMAIAGGLDWFDRDRGTISADPARFGDVVLARKDVPTSYHLAVTLDDHLQGVTLVTRGEDLLEATYVHRLLQALLGLDVPGYRHHRLLRGADGKRFAKRDRSLTLKALRESGLSADAVCRRAFEGYSE